MAFMSSIQPILPLNEVRTLQIFNVTLKKEKKLKVFWWFFLVVFVILSVCGLFFFGEEGEGGRGCNTCGKRVCGKF